MPQFTKKLKERLQEVVDESFNHGHMVANGIRELEGFTCDIDTLANFFIDLFDVEYANDMADRSVEFWRPRKVSDEEREEIDQSLSMMVTPGADGDLVGCRDEIITILGMRI